jgi:hypothetical protein
MMPMDLETAALKFWSKSDDGPEQPEPANGHD